MENIKEDIFKDLDFINYINEVLEGSPKKIRYEEILDGKIDVKDITNDELNDLVSDVRALEDFAYGTDEEAFYKNICNQIETIANNEKIRRKL